MTEPSLLLKLRDLAFGLAGGPIARLAWCRRQRRLLLVPGQPVVWVPRAEETWAIWGAEHRYFALERMDGLPYLSALSAPAT